MTPRSSRLHDVLAGSRGEVLLYGLTPPRQSTTPEDLRRIADLTLERISALDIDGLVLYDLDDESDRNEVERPFQFSPTLDPGAFLDHLSSWAGPTVLYRCVGKYADGELDSWLRHDERDLCTVFVGPSSRDKPVRTTLPTAHRIWHESGERFPLGGVTIPERHLRHRDEHLRMIDKQRRGCRFFITQVVYNVGDAKDLVSDYFYACQDKGLDPVPIVFTLSLCGSLRTLAFLEWLGVDVPHWLQNELRHAEDTLAESLDFCLDTARELATFCRRLGLPFGFNVESVSTRKVENEATVELARKLRRLLA